MHGSRLSLPGVLVSVLVVGLGFSSGCSQTIPTTPHGVLSTIHQKTLALATERALQQAGVTNESLGTRRVFVELREIPDSDLGKRHSARVAKDCIRSSSGGLVESATDADRTLSLDFLNAGVDVKNGAFFGFAWLETTAEVGIRVTSADGKSSPVETDGNGTAVFKQLWWLGIGPSESIK